MATIHISEIQSILASRGDDDALPHAPGGYFLEIRFDEANAPSGSVNEDDSNRVVVLESHFGTVTVQCDAEGQLKSIDLS